MVTKVLDNGCEMMKIRNGEHDHTVVKDTKNKLKRSKLNQRKSTYLMKFAAGRRTKPRTSPLLMSAKLPKLIPKPVLKIQNCEPKPDYTAFDTNRENDENHGPSAVTADDAENDIVDILD